MGLIQESLTLHFSALFKNLTLKYLKTLFHFDSYGLKVIFTVLYLNQFVAHFHRCNTCMFARITCLLSGNSSKPVRRDMCLAVAYLQGERDRKKRSPLKTNKDTLTQTRHNTVGADSIYHYLMFSVLFQPPDSSNQHISTLLMALLFHFESCLH